MFFFSLSSWPWEQLGRTVIIVEHVVMVSALDSGSSGTGVVRALAGAIVFLGKTLHSHGASLHPGV